MFSIFSPSDVNMYLPSKLFRSPQPMLNLNLPDSPASPDAQVLPPFFLFSPLMSAFCSLTDSSMLRLFLRLSMFSLKGPEAGVTTQSGIPRDASGAIDYNALAQLLKDTQSLQDQADILYILYKDK